MNPLSQLATSYIRELQKTNPAFIRANDFSNKTFI